MIIFDNTCEQGPYDVPRYKGEPSYCPINEAFEEAYLEDTDEGEDCE